LLLALLLLVDQRHLGRTRRRVLRQPAKNEDNANPFEERLRASMQFRYDFPSLPDGRRSTRSGGSKSSLLALSRVILIAPDEASADHAIKASEMN
jgi:hypothetical protein